MRSIFLAALFVCLGFVSQAADITEPHLVQPKGTDMPQAKADSSFAFSNTCYITESLTNSRTIRYCAGAGDKKETCSSKTHPLSFCNPKNFPDTVEARTCNLGTRGRKSCNDARPFYACRIDEKLKGGKTDSYCLSTCTMFPEYPARDPGSICHPGRYSQKVVSRTCEVLTRETAATCPRWVGGSPGRPPTRPAPTPVPTPPPSSGKEECRVTTFVLNGPQRVDYGDERKNCGPHCNPRYGRCDVASGYCHLSNYGRNVWDMDCEWGRWR